MTWGDKGREGVKKMEIGGDVIYGWSLNQKDKMGIDQTLKTYRIGNTIMDTAIKATWDP